MQENSALVSGRSPNSSHKVIGCASGIAFASALIGEVSNGTLNSGSGVYMAANIFGMLTSTLAIIPPDDRPDSKITLRGCVIPPSCPTQWSDSRRYLAFTSLASHMSVYILNLAIYKELEVFGIAMLFVASLNYALLALPQHSETAYILFGIFGGITSGGLMVFDMTKPMSPQAVCLGIANATLLSACVASVAINGRRHGAAITEANGFKAKAIAFICGKGSQIENSVV